MCFTLHYIRSEIVCANETKFVRNLVVDDVLMYVVNVLRSSLSWSYIRLPFASGKAGMITARCNERVKM